MVMKMNMPFLTTKIRTKCSPGQFDEESIHTNIFQVEARDIDLASWIYVRRIIYGFTPYILFNDNNPDHFSIDSDTGVISINLRILILRIGKGTVDSDSNNYVLEVSATTDV